MKSDVRQRIEQIRQGKVPAGYKKTKQGISPAEWTGMSVKDCLCRVEKTVQVEPETLYTQIGIRSHGNGIFYKEPVTGRALKNKSVFWIEPDCFILNIVFAWEQAVGRTTKAEKGMIGSHRFPMYRPIEDRVDIDYLVYYFLTPRGTNILEEASPGGAGRNRTLGQERFLKSTILLPPIAEQQKIAKILMTQDRKIALREKLLAEKLRQKQYLMQVLLTGKKRLPGYKGKWKTIRFGEVFSFGSTNSFSRQFMVSDGDGIHNIHYGDILTKYGEILDARITKLPVLMKEAGEKIKDFISDGDIVIADTAEDLTAGKVIEVQNVGTQKIAAGMHTMWCTPKRGYFAPGWLGFYMNSMHFHRQLIPYMAGIKVMAISKTNIVKTHLLVPSIDEQCAIVTILTCADREIELLKKGLEQERRKKKALMQLLLSGIVRVKP